MAAAASTPAYVSCPSTAHPWGAVRPALPAGRRWQARCTGSAPRGEVDCLLEEGAQTARRPSGSLWTRQGRNVDAAGSVILRMRRPEAGGHPCAHGSERISEFAGRNDKRRSSAGRLGEGPVEGRGPRLPLATGCLVFRGMPAAETGPGRRTGGALTRPSLWAHVTVRMSGCAPLVAHLWLGMSGCGRLDAQGRSDAAAAPPS
jgi:hypothetical protein